MPLGPYRISGSDPCSVFHRHRYEMRFREALSPCPGARLHRPGPEEGGHQQVAGRLPPQRRGPTYIYIYIYIIIIITTIHVCIYIHIYIYIHTYAHYYYQYYY